MSERPDAPGRLAVVEALVNTRDVETGEDDLTDLDTLRRWCRDHGLLGSDERLTGEALQDVVAVREALRVLLLANHDGVDAPVDALGVLDGYARQATVAVRFVDAPGELQPAGTGVDGVLGRLLAVVHDAMVDGSWVRLKACRNETCQWAFYDGSRNRSGKWCSMAVCGNRTKVSRFRSRHAPDGTGR